MRAQDLLPDHLDQADFRGVTVRKGTVGAFLANAEALADAGITADARNALLADVAASVPALRAIGLFTVMEIRDPALRRFVASCR